MSSQPDSPLRPPTPAAPSIPDFDLLRQIGRGSYGDVWLARGVTGMFRAIKIVWRERFAEPEPFEREFRGLREFAAISLGEPTQLALLHVGRNDTAGFFYSVMELADDAVRGREVDPADYTALTLAELSRRRGRVPVKECVQCGLELARSLAGLHRRGLVHRDIKPSNVIFVGGRPKLADIGLVALASSAHTYVGTEGYVPPEGPGSPGADVYALGKVLYELATGLDRQVFPKLPPGLDMLPDHRALLAFNEIVLRACEPQREKRYRDGAALLADLMLLDAGRPVRRFAPWQVAMAGVIGAGAIGGIWRLAAKVAPTRPGVVLSPVPHPATAASASPPVMLGPPRLSPTNVIPTKNPAAQDAFLRGRALQIRSAANAAAAAEFYERAVGLDPGFAVAWARLAEARFRPRGAGTDTSEAQLAAVWDALDHALAAQPDLPLALCVRGLVRGVARHEFEEARRDLAHAEELEGPTADSRMYRLLVAWEAGQRTGMAQLAREAIAADPGESGDRAGALANMLVMLGEFAEADRMYERAAALAGPGQPTAFVNRVYLRRQWRGSEAAIRLAGRAPENQAGAAAIRAHLLLGLGRIAEARVVLATVKDGETDAADLAAAGLAERARAAAEADRNAALAAFAKGNRSPWVRLRLISAEAALGHHEAALAELDAWREEVEARTNVYRRWGGAESNLTALCAALGRRDVVITRIRQAVAEGIEPGLELRDSISYAGLRHDPEFQELVRQAEARVAALPGPADDPDPAQPPAGEPRFPR